MAEAARSEKHIIEIREVWKTYRMGDEEVHALRGVTLDVIRGEYLSIMGPSGSGRRPCLIWSGPWTARPKDTSW